MFGTRRLRWLLLLGAVLACMGAVWLFSAQSGALSSGLSRRALGLIQAELPGVYSLLARWGRPEYLLRKLAHFGEYLLLGLLLYALLRRRFSPVAAAGLALVLAAAFACTDEWHQLSVPGRDGNLRDVLIDSAGAVAGVGLGGLGTGLRRLLSRRLGKKPA